MRKPLLYFASALILLPALWAFALRPAVSLLAAIDILSDQGGSLARIYPEVERAGVRISVGGKMLEADFYRRSGPGGSIKRPGLLLIHGLAEAGKDDPQLVRFATTMARAGFAVLVPDFAGTGRPVPQNLRDRTQICLQTPTFKSQAQMSGVLKH